MVRRKAKAPRVGGQFRNVDTGRFQNADDPALRARRERNSIANEAAALLREINNAHRAWVRNG